jgi:hypothetical protein
LNWHKCFEKFPDTLAGQLGRVIIQCTSRPEDRNGSFSLFIEYKRRGRQIIEIGRAEPWPISHVTQKCLNTIKHTTTKTPNNCPGIVNALRQIYKRSSWQKSSFQKIVNVFIKINIKYVLITKLYETLLLS